MSTDKRASRNNKYSPSSILTPSLPNSSLPPPLPQQPPLRRSQRTKKQNVDTLTDSVLKSTNLQQPEETEISVGDSKKPKYPVNSNKKKGSVSKPSTKKQKSHEQNISSLNKGSLCNLQQSPPRDSEIDKMVVEGEAHQNNFNSDSLHQNCILPQNELQNSGDECRGQKSKEEESQIESNNALVDQKNRFLGEQIGSESQQADQAKIVDKNEGNSSLPTLNSSQPPTTQFSTLSAPPFESSHLSTATQGLNTNNGCSKQPKGDCKDSNQLRFNAIEEEGHFNNNFNYSAATFLPFVPFSDVKNQLEDENIQGSQGMIRSLSFMNPQILDSNQRNNLEVTDQTFNQVSVSIDIIKRQEITQNQPMEITEEFKTQEVPITRENQKSQEMLITEKVAKIFAPLNRNETFNIEDDRSLGDTSHSFEPVFEIVSHNGLSKKFTGIEMGSITKPIVLTGKGLREDKLFMVSLDSFHQMSSFNHPNLPSEKTRPQDDSKKSEPQSLQKQRLDNERPESLVISGQQEQKQVGVSQQVISPLITNILSNKLLYDAKERSGNKKSSLMPQLNNQSLMFSKQFSFQAVSNTPSAQIGRLKNTLLMKNQNQDDNKSLAESKKSFQRSDSQMTNKKANEQTSSRYASPDGKILNPLLSIGTILQNSRQFSNRDGDQKVLNSDRSNLSFQTYLKSLNAGNNLFKIPAKSPHPVKFFRTPDKKEQALQRETLNQSDKKTAQKWHKFQFKTPKGSTITSNINLNAKSCKKPQNPVVQESSYLPIKRNAFFKRLQDNSSANFNGRFGDLGDHRNLGQFSKEGVNQMDRGTENGDIGCFNIHNLNSTLGPFLEPCSNSQMQVDYRGFNSQLWRMTPRNYGLKSERLNQSQFASPQFGHNCHQQEFSHMKDFHRKRSKKLQLKLTANGFKSSSKKTNLHRFDLNAFPQIFPQMIQVGSSQSTENNQIGLRFGGTTEKADVSPKLTCLQYSGSNFSTIKKTKRITDLQTSKSKNGNCSLNFHSSIHPIPLDLKSDHLPTQIANSSAETLKKNQLKESIQKNQFDSPSNRMTSNMHHLLLSKQKILNRFNSDRLSESSNKSDSSSYFDEEGEEEADSSYLDHLESESHPSKHHLKFGGFSRNFFYPFQGSQSFHYEDGLLSAITPGYPSMHDPMWYHNNIGRPLIPFDQMENLISKKQFSSMNQKELLHHLGGMASQRHQKGCKISCSCGLWQSQEYNSQKQCSQGDKMDGRRQSERSHKCENEESIHQGSMRSEGSITTINYNIHPQFNFSSQNYISPLPPTISESHCSPFPNMGFTGIFGLPPFNMGMIPGNFHFNPLGSQIYDQTQEPESPKQTPCCFGEKQPKSHENSQSMQKSHDQQKSVKPDILLGGKRKQPSTTETIQSLQKRPQKFPNTTGKTENKQTTILKTPCKHEKQKEESREINLGGTSNGNKRVFKSHSKKVQNKPNQQQIKFQVPNSCSKLKKTKQQPLKVEDSEEGFKKMKPFNNDLISIHAEPQSNQGSSSLRAGSGDQGLTEKERTNEGMMETPPKKQVIDGAAQGSQSNLTTANVKTQHKTLTTGAFESGNQMQDSIAKEDPSFQFRTLQSLDKKINPFNSELKQSESNLTQIQIAGTEDKHKQQANIQSFVSYSANKMLGEYSINQFNIEGFNKDVIQSTNNNNLICSRTTPQFLDDSAPSMIQPQNNSSTSGSAQNQQRLIRQSCKKITNPLILNQNPRLSNADKEILNRRNEEKIRYMTDKIISETVSQDEFLRRNESQEPRPSCNGCKCKSTKCLKLYCECLRNKAFCGPYCQCKNQMGSDCYNNEEHQEDRKKAIEDILKRNIEAFENKVDQDKKEHFKGCRCKNSQCQKNYCECYERGVPCIPGKCKCKNCKNDTPCRDHVNNPLNRNQQMEYGGQFQVYNHNQEGGEMESNGEDGVVEVDQE